MANKINDIEDEIVRLSNEYNEIRRKWEYTGSVLGVRKMEIKNKRNELQKLRDALVSGDGQNG